jgi:hypothetical protein
MHFGQNRFSPSRCPVRTKGNPQCEHWVSSRPPATMADSCRAITWNTLLIAKVVVNQHGQGFDRSTFGCPINGTAASSSHPETRSSKGATRPCSRFRAFLSLIASFTISRALREYSFQTSIGSHTSPPPLRATPRGTHTGSTVVIERRVREWVQGLRCRQRPKGPQCAAKAQIFSSVPSANWMKSSSAPAPPRN